LNKKDFRFLLSEFLGFCVMFTFGCVFPLPFLLGGRSGLLSGFFLAYVQSMFQLFGLYQRLKREVKSGVGMEGCNSHVNSSRFGQWISFGLELTFAVRASSVHVNSLSPVLDLPLCSFLVGIDEGELLEA
jgi:hypothetical protein